MAERLWTIAVEKKSWKYSKIRKAMPHPRPKSPLGPGRNGGKNKPRFNKGEPERGVSWSSASVFSGSTALPKRLQDKKKKPGKGNVGTRGQPVRSELKTSTPKPRPRLTKWFRRSLSICLSINYPVLLPASLLWWQPEQSSRNSICYSCAGPLYSSSTFHSTEVSHFPGPRWKEAGSVPGWCGIQCPPPSVHTNKTSQRIPGL